MNSKLVISLYSHQDEYIDLLFNSDKEFIGQCTNPILTVNANGSKSLTLTLPLKYYDVKTSDYVDNPRWNYITNQYKIRVEQEGQTIEEFVLRDYSETHSESDQLTVNINCMSLAEFQLSQIGYDLKFDENSLYIYPEQLDPNDPDTEPIGVSNADIHFWAKKILENSDWQYKVRSFYEVDTDMATDNRQQIPSGPDDHVGTNQFYEKDRIIDYNDNNQPIKKDKYDIKERIIKEEKSNRWNIIQTLCEQFEVWASFDIVYKNKKVFSKTVVFRNDIPEDALFSVRYTKNLKNVNRQVDDSQIVTKMYVTPLANPNTDSGLVAVADNEKNFLKENYLLDFSWYLGDKRKDTDLINHSLINPDLSLKFKSSKFGIPAINEYTTKDTKETIEEYKKNLRARNKFINSKSAQLNKAKQELTDLKTKYEYYLGQRDSALEEVNKILDEFALIPKGPQYKENKIVYLYNEGGHTIIRFSEIGIREVPLSNSFHAPNNVADLQDNSYDEQTIKGLQLKPYKREPITGSITEVSVENGKIGTLQNYAAFRMTIEYYPLDFYTKLKKYWEAKVTEATHELAELGRGKENGDTSGKIYEKEIEVEQLKLTLFQSQLEKRSVVEEFEKLMAPFVREGYWEDSSYTTYMNKIESLTNQKPKEDVVKNVLPAQQWSTDYWCYKIPNKPMGEIVVNGVHKTVYLYDIIDIESIEVMNKDIVNSKYDENFKIYVKGPTHATVGTDYTVEYGYSSTDKTKQNRGIYINFYEPENGSVFTQTTETRMYVRAKARGANYYIFDGYINNQTYINTDGKKARMFYSPLEQILVLDHEDVILSSVKVTLDGAGIEYINDQSLKVVPGSHDLIYGVDYYTFKEVKDDKTFTKIKLNYTTNVPLLSFDEPNHVVGYSINCNYDVTSKYYYNDALKTMQESSIPQVTYTISVADLSQLELPDKDYSNFKPIAGTRIPIYDEELRFFGLVGFINSVSFHLLEPQNTEIVISNFKDKFEDLFQKITAATIQLQNKGDYYDYATTITTNKGTINKNLLEDTLMQNDMELRLSDKNDVVWNEKGISVTNKEKNENGVFGKMRITSNGIFISDKLDEYGNYKWETAITPSYINASKITVGKLDTRQIQIWNSSQPRFLWNENGIYAYGEDKNKQTDFDTYVLYNQNGLQFRTQVIKKEGTQFKNLIQNPNFVGSFSNQWSTVENATLDIESAGSYNCLVSTQRVDTQKTKIQHHALDLKEDDKYYYRVRAKLEGVSPEKQQEIAAGLGQLGNSVSYNMSDEFITISGMTTGATAQDLFNVTAILSEIKNGWKLKITEPMLIDVTQTFGKNAIISVAELDKLPFFIDNYTYDKELETHKDIVSLTWDGFNIDAQDGALKLTSQNGLEVLQPKASSINGIDKQLRVQVGQWNEVTDNGEITKYGIRGLDEKGNTFFEVSQAGFKIRYGDTNDTIDNIIDGSLAYSVTIHSSNGNVFKNRNIDTVLTAVVMKGQENVTDKLKPFAFVWERVSADKEADALWNQEHAGVGSTISITQDDVLSQATFNCSIQL